MTAFRIGFLVNPIAGIGGPLGWHGSDRPRGRGRGGPGDRHGSGEQAGSGKRHGLENRHGGGLRDQDDLRDQSRATRALAALARQAESVGLSGRISLLTAGGSMGADVAAASGLSFVVVHEPERADTSAADTRRAVAAMVDADVDIIVFVGGDGTARDVCAVAGMTVPVVGVPSGVKMHSGVFGRTPEAAASAVAGWLVSGAPAVPVDVVDLDEDARERGHLTTRLFGQLLVPRSPEIQRGKVSVRGGGGPDVTGLAAGLEERIKPGHALVFGPGSTVQSVGAELGWDLSLLGVDVVTSAGLVRDVSADQLDDALGATPVQVIVSPIGNQGMVLGRGNQPIDERVLRRLEPSDLIIVCSPEKLATLRGELYVDTPSLEHNQRFSGPHRVVTGHRQEAVVTIR